MSDLFISYASQDREVIQKLVAALEAQGWNVWWDRHIDIGSNFDDRIEKAISETLCIVVVWSKHSIGSNWVRAEATEGLERNILVPILIDDVRPPLLFRQKQSISLVDWRHGTQEAGQLGDLIPSIASILASYSTSTLPVSTQRAWVVGRIESDPELEQLARAAYVALFLGLSYFENLFLYTSAFRGSSARSLGAEALSALVDEEGLDGFIHGALSSTPQGILFQLNVRSRDAAQTAPFTQISPVESLGLGVGQCLLSSAEALQGGRPADADRMLDFLGDRVTESLGFVWQSFQYADQNDYGRVKTACEAALQKDPGFSLLHQALATAYQYLGRWSDARETIARAIRSTHKESRQSVARARGMYFAMYSEDYARASEEFESLLKMSPLDESGINNLAVCRFYQLQFDQARELSTRDLSLYPMKKIGLQNAAFYSLYAGAFEEADERARSLLEQDAKYVNCQVIRGLVSAYRGDEHTADRLYASALSGTSHTDAVLLQARADLAMGRGDLDTADGLLRRGLVLDRERQNSEYAARKLLMSAELALLLDPASAAGTDAIRDALGLSSSTATLAVAALVCIRFNVEPPEALGSLLKSKVGTHGSAYARMFAGYTAQRSGDLGTAKLELDEAIGLADLWLIRLSRAILFERSGLPLEASDEIEACLARPGEALSAALDEQPTWRYAVLARTL